MNHAVEVHDVTLGYGDRVIVPKVNVTLEKPEIISIIGPNGSGKSTLLKAMSRLLLPLAGTVLLDGKNIHRMKSAEVARIMAVLPQMVKTPPDMTVYDLVSYGRFPHHSFYQGLVDEDHGYIEKALVETGMQKMAYRRLDTLSGGERQRAWLAMALSQEPKILMLDEPTTYLDIHHQLELMKLIQKLYKDRKITVVMVLHDLNHAVRFSQRIIAVKDGAVFADGPVKKVVTPEHLRQLYGVETLILSVEQGGEEQIVCFPHDICIPCSA